MSIGNTKGTTMEKHEITALITQELPGLLAHDPVIREHIKELVTPYFALRYETESRFDQLLGELRQMREESERKWAEYKEEQHQIREESERKWAEFKEELRQMREESERKWAEQKAESERKWAEFKEELRQMREEFQEEMRQMREESEHKWAEHKEETARKDEEYRKEIASHVAVHQQISQQIKSESRRVDIKLGAIGARWGVDSEASFRNALKGILEEVAEVEVLNINEYDGAGEVFGRPEQVEMDIVIQNGKVIVCELKSSISKGDVALLDRKAAYYEKHHQRAVSQKVIISPMVDPRALPLAEKLGIKVYYNVEDASFNED